MKLFLRTWRTGQDLVMGYHGAGVSYDSAAHVLYVSKPVLKETVGDLYGITVTSGDEWWTELCANDCRYHDDDPKTVQTEIRD